MPKEKILKAYQDFIQEKYGDGEFPAFEAADSFFKHFLKTDYSLNDFANLPSTAVKKSDRFEFVRKDKVNFYRISK